MMPGNLGVEAIVLHNITSSHPCKLKTAQDILVEIEFSLELYDSWSFGAIESFICALMEVC